MRYGLSPLAGGESRVERRIVRVRVAWQRGLESLPDACAKTRAAGHPRCCADQKRRQRVPECAQALAGDPWPPVVAASKSDFRGLVATGGPGRPSRTGRETHPCVAFPSASGMREPGDVDVDTAKLGATGGSPLERLQHALRLLSAKAIPRARPLGGLLAPAGGHLGDLVEYGHGARRLPQKRAPELVGVSPTRTSGSRRRPHSHRCHRSRDLQAPPVHRRTGTCC